MTADNPCPTLLAQDGVSPDRCLINDRVCENNPGTGCNCDGLSCYQQQDVCATFCPDTTTACGTDADCGGEAGSCSVINDPSCSNPCPGLGEFCDLRTHGGWALAPTSLLANGKPDPNICHSSRHIYRGTVNEFCTLFRTYDVVNGSGDPAVLGSDQTAWGDPGPDCSANNMGGTMRPDLDCNGIDDTMEGPNPTGDLCPYYTETNLLGDTDGNGRGDDCECGDTNRDGVVDIVDILEDNSWIFTHPGGASGCTFGTPGCTLYRREFGLSDGYARLWLPLGDTNNDPPLCDEAGGIPCAPPADPMTADANEFWDTGGTIDIIDILNANDRIFGNLPQPSCARYPICGDGALDPGNVPFPGQGAASGPGERCDDGNNTQGDGCDNSCQVEPGWSCDQAEPSNCTQL